MQMLPMLPMQAARSPNPLLERKHHQTSSLTHPQPEQAAKQTQHADALTSMLIALTNGLAAALLEVVQSAFASAQDPNVRAAVDRIRLSRSVSIASTPDDATADLRALAPADLLNKALAMQEQIDGMSKELATLKNGDRSGSVAASK